MNARENARLGLRRAEIILEEAGRLKEREIWNLAVRRSQEAVEMALKAALLWIGVQPPRLHDVGPSLREHASRFPDPFASSISRLASISRSLRNEREKSFYGDEESGLPPEQLYGEEDAVEALEKAGFVLELCRRLMEG